MAEIQAPIVAADINDDGKIELVTVDAHGNVAAWTTNGKEIWEVHLKSLIPQVSFFHVINYNILTQSLNSIRFIHLSQTK